MKKKLVGTKKTIGFLTPKGGALKTTLNEGVAYSKTFRRHANSIGLVELDPQGNLKQRHEARKLHQRPQYNVTFQQILETDPTQVKPKLIELYKKHDLVIIDPPGESEAKFRTKLALTICDTIFIPLQTSTNEEDSFEKEFLPLIKQTIQDEPEKKNNIYILPTAHPQTKIETLQEYFNDIMPDYIQCLPIYFPHREIYKNFNREGRTIYEYAETVKNNRKKYQQAQTAMQDVENIAKTILEILVK